MQQQQLLGQCNNAYIDYPRFLADVSALLIRAIKFECRATAWQVNQYLSPPYPGDHLLQHISCLFRETRISYSIAIIGLLYLLRFQQNANLLSQQMTEYFRVDDNAFVLFVVAMMLSSKWVVDRPPSNSVWSARARIPLNVLNRQEMLFLNVISHDLFVDADYFQNWLRYLFQPKHTSSYHIKIAQPASASIYHQAQYKYLQQELKNRRKRRISLKSNSNHRTRQHSSTDSFTLQK